MSPISTKNAARGGRPDAARGTVMGAKAAWTGGVRLAGHKRPASESPIVDAAPPARAIMALRQGAASGTALACVAPGQRVRRGQVIATAAEPGGACLHSPVGGTVAAIEPRPVASDGGTGACIVIDADESQGAVDFVRPFPDYAMLEPDALLLRLRDSGLVGLGGAAYPSSAKLESARRNEVKHLVLNGAECEPWICCDDRLMRERTGDVIRGAQIMMHAIGASRGTIGIEDDKPEAIAAIRAAIAKAADARLDVQVVPAVYPAGSETQLIESLCGFEVPRGALPSDAGVLCHNVGTAAATARFVETGEPLLRRIVTIAGGGVARPCNVEAWIGTPLAELIELAGGYAGTVERLIVGGGMCGLAVPTDEVPLTKSANCVIAATHADLAASGPRVEMPCIRCGECATVCPVDLLPQQLHVAACYDDVEMLDRFGLDACIECGCCDHVCPSHIPLTPRFHRAKSRVQRLADDAVRSADSRERYQRHLAREAQRDAAERNQFERARRDDGGPGGT